MAATASLHSKVPESTTHREQILSISTMVAQAPSCSSDHGLCSPSIQILHGIDHHRTPEPSSASSTKSRPKIASYFENLGNAAEDEAASTSAASTSAASSRPLFPIQALPDELLIQCLARVKGADVGPGCILLRGVCRRWRRLVKSAALLDHRVSVGRGQEWLVTLTRRTAGGLLCKLFDPQTNKCQRLMCSLDNLPPERQHFGAVSVGRDIFILGGECAVQDTTGTESEVHYLDTVEAYDAVMDQCRRAPALPGGGRSRFACCSGEGRVYVFGGVGENGRVVQSCAVYDTRTSTWAEIAHLRRPRVAGQAKWCGGRLVLLGGREDVSEASPSVHAIEALEFGRNEWVTLPPLPLPRCNFEATSLGGLLCVVGGDRVLGEEEELGAVNDADGKVVCFNTPVVFDERSQSWGVWKMGSGYSELRSVEGAEDRLHCQHLSCSSYQSRSYAVAAVYDELFLVRRCDKGKSSYCRHIHRFVPTLALGGSVSAWDCIHRRKAFSSLLREAGDCWEHSIVEVISC